MALRTEKQTYKKEELYTFTVPQTLVRLLAEAQLGPSLGIHYLALTQDNKHSYLVKPV